MGLLIGVVENLIYYASVQTWFPKDHGTPLPGLHQLIEFLLVVLALFIMGSRLRVEARSSRSGCRACHCPSDSCARPSCAR